MQLLGVLTSPSSHMGLGDTLHSRQGYVSVPLSGQDGRGYFRPPNFSKTGFPIRRVWELPSALTMNNSACMSITGAYSMAGTGFALGAMSSA